MKKTILIGSLVLNVVLAIFVVRSLTSKEAAHLESASTETGKGNETRQEMVKEGARSLYVSGTANEVKIDVAIDNLKRFYLKYKDLRAYKISAVDMMEVMGIDSTAVTPKYNFCRAYLGLETSGNFKLYLTPVVANYDVFFNDTNPDAGKAQKNSYVLDLIAPCPNTCDTSSPLYTFNKP
ncbi:hypothetical protein [Fluviicola sp.]|uniref:hypothetical protein n=1 Tax=Fluviicola sp. TaxID=1917219 RepID=UPI0031E42AA4